MKKHWINGWLSRYIQPQAKKPIYLQHFPTKWPHTILNNSNENGSHRWFALFTHDKKRIKSFNTSFSPTKNPIIKRDTGKIIQNDWASIRLKFNFNWNDRIAVGVCDGFVQINPSMTMKLWANHCHLFYPSSLKYPADRIKSNRSIFRSWLLSIAVCCR